LKEESWRLFKENNRHLSNILCEQYTDQHVALDRFFLSTTAYHTVFLRNKSLWLDIASDLENGLVVTPDKYFILDVPLEERIRRSKQRDPHKMCNEKIDSIYLHEYVLAEFRNLASKLKYCVMLDGTKTQEELLKIILDRVKIPEQSSYEANCRT